MGTKRLLLAALLLIWATAGAYYYRQTMLFETEPGQASASPPHWPRTSGITRTAGSSTLLVFLHPKCDCSRATLTQLSKLRQRIGNRFQMLLVVWQPVKGDSSWQKLKALEAGSPFDASTANLIWDGGGKLASLFDAHTSGQTLLYDSRGSLQFSGGLTSLRGRADDGPALTSIENALLGRLPGSSTPVFGCAL